LKLIEASSWVSGFTQLTRATVRCFVRIWVWPLDDDTTSRQHLWIDPLTQGLIKCWNLKVHCMHKTLFATSAAVLIAYFFSVFFKPYTSNSNIDAMALSSVTRNVVKKVLAVETPEGAGALVRRSIGSMSLRNLTPFLLLDHFHVEEGVRSFPRNLF
jgi:hypothetical protein